MGLDERGRVTRARHGVVGAHLRVGVYVRAWSVDRLLGTRDVRARNCVPVLKLFISPTTADPRRTPHTVPAPTEPAPAV